MRVFPTIDMLRSGNNPVLPLQPINAMGEFVYFRYLKKHLEQTSFDEKKGRFWNE